MSTLDCSCDCLCFVRHFTSYWLCFDASFFLNPKKIWFSCDLTTRQNHIIQIQQKQKDWEKSDKFHNAGFYNLCFSSFKIYVFYLHLTFDRAQNYLKTTTGTLKSLFISVIACGKSKQKRQLCSTYNHSGSSSFLLNGHNYFYFHLLMPWESTQLLPLLILECSFCSNDRAQPAWWWHGGK